MSELTKRLRESQLHLSQRAFRDQCGSPDCAISASLAEEAADRIDAMEECLREFVRVSQTASNPYDFSDMLDPVYDKARALLESQ